MSKKREFKVGDRVKITEGIHDDDVKGVVIGKEKIDNDYFYTVDLGFEISGCTHNAKTCRFYPGRRLKDASDDNWKVVITPKGDTTSIRLYENDEVVKSETVRCDVNDKYDKNVAIRESVNKLLGYNVVEPKEDLYPNGYLRWWWYSDTLRIGKIGERSCLTDQLGNPLSVGDIVLVIEPMLDFAVEHGHHVVIHDENGYHVEGCQENPERFRYFKITDWQEVRHGTLIYGVEYITEGLDV